MHAHCQCDSWHVGDPEHDAPPVGVGLGGQAEEEGGDDAAARTDLRETAQATPVPGGGHLAGECNRDRLLDTQGSGERGRSIGGTQRGGC